LSDAFNGDLGPAAIDPGEVLGVARRMSPGLAPLSQRTALLVAREVGAGQVTVGSIVSSGRRVVVTTSILNVPKGDVRVASVRVEGTADSLPALMSALRARLLGRAAGVLKVGETDPGSVSQEAILAYVAAMQVYRQKREREAWNGFARAFELDSAFVGAALRLVYLRALYGGNQPGSATVNAARLYRTLWLGRSKLSSEQRRLVEAIADSTALLSRARGLPALESAAKLSLNSAEIWRLLGDYYFHEAGLSGHPDWLERSKFAFLLALALDAPGWEGATTHLSTHLSQLAFVERDRVAFERHAKSTLGGSESAEQKYLGAILRGNPAAVRGARIAFSAAVAREEAEWPAWVIRGVTLPPTELDSLFMQLEADVPGASRGIAVLRIMAAMLAGRPAQVAAAEQQFLQKYLKPGDSAQVYVELLKYAEHDSAAAERLAGMLDNPVVMSGTDSTHGPVSCQVGLSRMRRGDTTGVSAILARLRGSDSVTGVAEFQRTFPSLTRIPPGPARTPVMMRRQSMVCGEVLRGIHASFTPSGGPALWRADSILALRLACCEYWTYDIAHAFARRGDYRAAAAAARRRGMYGGEPQYKLAVSLRHEGRWSALAGDTAAAIRAYRHYLLWRENPEPVLVPQRDSVRTELAALLKARRR